MFWAWRGSRSWWTLLVFATILGLFAAWLTVYGSADDWNGRMGIYTLLLWAGAVVLAVAGCLSWVRRHR